MSATATGGGFRVTGFDDAYGVLGHGGKQSVGPISVSYIDVGYQSVDPATHTS